MVLRWLIKNSYRCLSGLIGLIFLGMTVSGCSSLVAHHRLKSGIDQYNRENYHAAQTEFHKVLSQSVKNVVARQYLGWTEYCLNNYVAAHSVFQRLIEEPSIASAVKADAWHGLARCAYMSHQYQRAKEAAASSLAIRPEQMELWLLMGWAELYCYQYSDAEHAFRTALELESANGEAWLGIGWSCIYRSDFQGARLAATKARRWNPPEHMINSLEQACKRTR